MSVLIKHLLDTFEALLLGVLAQFLEPLLRHQLVEEGDEIDTAVGIGSGQLGIDFVHAQFLLQVVGNLFVLTVAENHHLADIQQLGDHIHRVADLREIDDTAFVVDVSERKRLTTVGHAEIAKGIGDGGAVFTDNVGANHRDERLHIDHYESTLRISLSRNCQQKQKNQSQTLHAANLAIQPLCAKCFRSI